MGRIHRYGQRHDCLIFNFVATNTIEQHRREYGALATTAGSRHPSLRPRMSQYTSIAFGLRCRKAGVRPSMGSTGDCYDNALCESFFATLECERLDRRNYRTQAEARMSVFQYIEGWYNLHRRHSALGYLSPMNFEKTSSDVALAAD